MSDEEEKLLLIDLAARVPYGVKVQIKSTYTDDEYITVFNSDLMYLIGVKSVKPYLRPIHKLTKEELEELEFLTDSDYVDYCNEHHTDYRNLIPKGLALEAKEGMYQ